MIFGFRKQKKAANKSISDYKLDAVVKLGRDQFKKLVKIGVNIPVALL